MIIRYQCPQASAPDAYMLLDTHTRIGVGYYVSGAVRWDSKDITPNEELTNIETGVWVLDPLAIALRLPEGF